ncbi:asparaginase domain-containing protein [Natrialbaceae archaeon GCM10025896]
MVNNNPDAERVDESSDFDKMSESVGTKSALTRRTLMKIAGASGIVAGTGSMTGAAGADEHESDEDGEDEESEELPEILLVGSGGTVANPETEGYLSPSELVEARPELEEVANISVAGVSQLGSSQLNKDVLFGIHDAIMEAAESSSPPDGVVVTVGSNTVEEVLYFLNLSLKTELPVVGTAAQRGVDALGTDSDKNLYDAVRVAGHPDAAGRGALLMVNDEIFHARDVTKLVSSRPDGWSSPNTGPVGLTDGGIEFYQQVERASYPDTEFDLSNRTPEDFSLGEIDITYSALGMEGRMVDAAVEAGTKGFVDAALLTGTSARPDGKRGLQSALRHAAQDGIPVVTSHRGTQGVITGDEDFIGGGSLTPQKARILLAFGMMEGKEGEELRELFETY